MQLFFLLFSFDVLFPCLDLLDLQLDTIGLREKQIIGDYSGRRITQLQVTKLHLIVHKCVTEFLRLRLMTSYQLNALWTWLCAHAEEDSLLRELDSYMLFADSFLLIYLGVLHWRSRQWRMRNLYFFLSLLAVTKRIGKNELTISKALQSSTSGTPRPIS